MRQTWSSACKHILWYPTKIPFLPPLKLLRKAQAMCYPRPVQYIQSVLKVWPSTSPKIFVKAASAELPPLPTVFSLSEALSTQYNWWWCSQPSSCGWAFISPFNFSFLPQVPWSCQWTCVNENIRTHPGKWILHTNTSHCHTNKMLVHTRSWLLRASHSI